MFNTIIVQPIFNLLVLIYAILPGHNFGIAIIIFTIIVRLCMWPLVKKQLHNAKAMRSLAPELKKIKESAKGDRQKQSALTMELYKERGINPFSSIGIMLVQLPIILGLYLSISHIVKNPHELISFAYPWVSNLDWMQYLASDIHHFDDSLFGIVNLTRSALGPEGLYLPALALVIMSAIVQFFQTKQLMPQDESARGLRKILKEASSGQSADQQEVNAAIGRFTLYIIPCFVLLFGLHFPAALPLYWLVSSSVALLQQSIILRKDVEEATSLTVTTRTESAASSSKNKTKKKPTPKKKSNKAKGRKRK